MTGDEARPKTADGAEGKRARAGDTVVGANTTAGGSRPAEVIAAAVGTTTTGGSMAAITSPSNENAVAEEGSSPFIAPKPLHRSSTTTPSHLREWGGRIDTTSRPRGSTLSGRPRFNSTEMSPRGQDRRGIPALSPGADRGRKLSEQAAGTPLERITTNVPMHSEGIRRRGTVDTIRQGSVASASGRSPSVRGGFTLAGPQENVRDYQAPYVDPGYAELNPAYEQPVNARPVWGLAKPLPRVVRPGMVPTASELNTTGATPAGVNHDLELKDLEAGRVEPTLNLNKISPQLQIARERRESRVLQRYGSRTSATGMFNLDSRVAGSLSRHDEALPEEEVEDPDATYPFPDAASEVTQAEDDEWMEESEPLKPYGYGPVEEVHNLHTHWSVIRTQFREPLAELLAVSSMIISRCHPADCFIGSCPTDPRLFC